MESFLGQVDSAEKIVMGLVLVFKFQSTFPLQLRILLKSVRVRWSRSPFNFSIQTELMMTETNRAPLKTRRSGKYEKGEEIGHQKRLQTPLSEQDSIGMR